MRHALLLTVCLIVLVAGLSADPQGELDALREMVPSCQVVPLATAAGTVRLDVEQSLTVDDLRGLALDAEAPELGPAPEGVDPRMTDYFPPGEAPYVAEGIEPFRLKQFTVEFSYGGWHNWAMHDYAITHGFSVLSPYNYKIEDRGHVPEGTRWLHWGGFVDWHKWLPENGVEDGRYDKLADMDVKGALLDEAAFADPGAYDQLMIDLEHGFLSPDRLREQNWYPTEGTDAERADFESRYYGGYAKTYTGPVQAARERGWKDISLYGWQPFDRRWFGIENAEIDPASDQAWNAYGKAIYETVDILNPSVYCFYWSDQNVAYTLANIDLNMQLVESMPERKPMRPYYWTLLHGGGGGWRWWQNQPVRDEDVRAMVAMCFFTGCDGLVLWNWSGTGNHHRPGPLKADMDVMLAQGLELVPEGEDDAPATSFARYDALHVIEVTEDRTVRFQRVERDNARGNYGIAEDKPAYAIGEAELLPHLRASSEPVAAFVEGLALIKPLEEILRKGDPKIDVDARVQFSETLPIVRRVKLGSAHVLITYDPRWASETEPRRIVLENFDGHEGLTLDLPADAETRVFLLREEP